MKEGEIYICVNPKRAVKYGKYSFVEGARNKCRMPVEKRGNTLSIHGVPVEYVNEKAFERVS